MLQLGSPPPPPPPPMAGPMIRFEPKEMELTGPLTVMVTALWSEDCRPLSL